MADREKILNKLAAALVQMHGCGRYTPEDVDELEKAAWDVLKMLEEERPIQPVYNGDCDWEECPNCGYVLEKKYNPCPGCGRPIKWE